MPCIRVNCSSGSLGPARKADIAGRLVDIVMSQEIDPLTGIARVVAPLVFNEISAEN